MYNVSYIYIYACFGISTDSVKLIRDKQNVSFLKLWHSTNLNNLLNRLHTISRRFRGNKSHYQILSFFLYQTICPDAEIYKHPNVIHFSHSMIYYILIHKNGVQFKFVFLKNFPDIKITITYYRLIFVSKNITDHQKQIFEKRSHH